MNICAITRDFIPPWVNMLGGHVQTLQILKQLKKTGDSVTVITSVGLHRSQNWKHWCGSQELVIEPIELSWNYNPISAELMQLLKVIKAKNSFDVIHIYSPLIFKSIPYNLTKRKVFQTIYYISSSRLMYVGLNFSLKFCKKIICSSNFLKNAICKALGYCDEKITYVPVGIDTERFNPTHNSRYESNIMEEKVIVLYLGQLRPEKGMFTLIRAIPKILKKNREIRFLVASNHIPTRFKESLHTYIKKGSLTVLEGIFDSAKLITSADVVVYPIVTYVDIMSPSLTCLETMACGRPLIASNIGGINEVVENGKNGILVSPSNCGELVDAVGELTKSDNMRKMLGLNARKTIELNHRLEFVVSKIKSLYYD